MSLQVRLASKALVASGTRVFGGGAINALVVHIFRAHAWCVAIVVVVGHFFGICTAQGQIIFSGLGNN